MIILGEQSIHITGLMGAIVGDIQSKQLGGDKIKGRYGDFVVVVAIVVMY